MWEAGPEGVVLSKGNAAGGVSGNSVASPLGTMCGMPPFAAGSAPLGQLPDPSEVEGLGLPVFKGPEGESQVSAELATGVKGGSQDSGQQPLEDSPTTKCKKQKEPDVQPFVFSQGFPPVPAKLVGKILRLEFVDMAELLRDNMEAERRGLSQGEGSSAKHPQRREVPDILSWIQCFGIYISVMASKFPERVPHMLAYQTMLVREARRCGGRGWLAYDTAFRQQAATDSQVDWSKLNSSLYPVTFMAQASGKGRCCVHCLEPDHAAEDCALSPRGRQETRQRQRSPGRSPSTRGVEWRSGGETSEYSGVVRPRAVKPGGLRQERKICYSYNDGECRFPSTCRFLHICQRCRADDHPAARCTVGLGVRDATK